MGPAFDSSAVAYRVSCRSAKGAPTLCSDQSSQAVWPSDPNPSISRVDPGAGDLNLCSDLIAGLAWQPDPVDRLADVRRSTCQHGCKNFRDPVLAAPSMVGADDGGLRLHTRGR